MIAVNLLPWRYARLQRQRRVSTGFTIIMLLALLLAAALQLWRLNRISQQLQAAQRDTRSALTVVEQQLSQRRALQQQLMTQQAQRRRAQQHVDELMRWHQFWQSLPLLLPDSLWLQRVEKLPAQLRIEGRAQDMQAIRDFRRRLKELPLFTAVKQGNVQRQQDGLYRFALRAQTGEFSNE